jgi:hypothetical protein
MAFLKLQIVARATYYFTYGGIKSEPMHWQSLQSAFYC